MNRTLFNSFLTAVAAFVLSCCSSSDYEYIKVDAPFPMPEIAVYNFPDKDFDITAYGAVRAGEADSAVCLDANTKAFADAMQACCEAGGGRVVVPAGEWSCGPIHFRSNCNLYLSKDAKVSFIDDPQRYLPAVEVSWEGMECMNYSPLVYAYQCKNIAITGTGTLAPKMGVWSKWFKRPKPHMDALAKLYNWASFDEPVENRQMAVDDNNLRPHLIHFNQCENVLLDSFRIRRSPFWTIHVYRCNGGVARNLDVYAHGHNNDGIDIEMTKNFLVENCVFDQGDDAVVIKAGRNQDAWRVNCPTENIVIRNCRVKNGHGLLVCGSEISGGLRNIYMHDCAMDDKVMNLFYIKTNHRRGAIIENIFMERVSANRMQRAFAVDTDVLYQWKDLVPTYKDSITQIRNIVMRDVRCNKADGIYQINGDERMPLENITIENLHVDTVYKYIDQAVNVNNLKTDNITWDVFLGDENAEHYTHDGPTHPALQ